MPNNREIVFRIEGLAVKEHSVPFKLLANVLDGIQSTFYCIGMETAGKVARSRGRIPVEIQQACELRRIAEKPGSYAVTAKLSAIYQMQLFGFDLGKATLDKFMKLVDYLTGDPESKNVCRIFPDGIHRRRILRSVEKYCPRKGDEWALVFDDKVSQKKNILTDHSLHKIREALDLASVEMLTVTGELMRLHLDEHKISILYPQTNRILDCFYDVEIEDFIIGNLKGMIQVTGRVQLDASGHPDKIIDAISINELDLSTVTLNKISSSGLTLHLMQPIIMEAQFDEQEFILEWPAFNIIASGATREEAINTFEEDFVWLWKEYGKYDDNKLSPDALQLKNDLLALAKE